MKIMFIVFIILSVIMLFGLFLTIYSLLNAKECDEDDAVGR